MEEGSKGMKPLIRLYKVAVNVVVERKLQLGSSSALIIGQKKTKQSSKIFKNSIKITKVKKVYFHLDHCLSLLFFILL